MSLQDEIKISQTPDQRIAAETYGRHNNRAHDEIERHTQEFLKRGKIDVRHPGDSVGTIKKFTINGNQDI